MQFSINAIFLEPKGGIAQNLHGYSIVTSLNAGDFGDLDLIFKVTGGPSGEILLYPQYLLDQPVEFHQTCMNISYELIKDLCYIDLIFKVTKGRKYLKFS